VGRAREQRGLVRAGIPLAGRGSKAWNDVVGATGWRRHKTAGSIFFSRELYAARARRTTGPACRTLSRPVESAKATEYPFLLISQEMMTHTRNWSGSVASLQEAYGLQTRTRWDSWVEINPEAARALGIADGDTVWVESPAGRIKRTLTCTPASGRTQCTCRTARACFARPVGTIQGIRATADRRESAFDCVQRTEELSGSATAMPVRVKVHKV